MGDMTDDTPTRQTIEAAHPGWRIHRAGTTNRQIRYTEIPAGHYYAVHHRLAESPESAPDLTELAERLHHRDRHRREAERWSVRTDLRRILPIIRRPAGPTPPAHPGGRP
jgi:hypothetical protein